MQNLKLGIIGGSFKENEKRLPIHPADFQKIPIEFREYIFIDKNYGINFGYTDEQLKPYIGGILSKDEIYDYCDVILILKYTKPDYVKMGMNKICWGWHHLVQNKGNVDIILKKNITAISIEQMFDNGKYILEENRLMAGYASIMHAFQLKGITGYLCVSTSVRGNSNTSHKVAVLSHGWVGRGAVDALKALSINNIDVYTKRDPIYLDNTEKREGVRYLKYVDNDKWKDTLLNYDIIVNCVLQDPLNPIMYLNYSDLIGMKKDKKLFIVDISCDKGMGFDFAVSTTFDEPIIHITDNVDFYGVDHSPSVFYDTVTRRISEKIISYVPFVVGNNINDNITLKNAIEIENGIILNNMISQFQNR